MVAMQESLIRHIASSLARQATQSNYLDGIMNKTIIQRKQTLG
ncbi:Uncharacterised protein [Halioglobus japonicus]|nr:Uncharacterised protein [Halioglobus japonicus]